MLGRGRGRMRGDGGSFVCEFSVHFHFFIFVAYIPLLHRWRTEFLFCLMELELDVAWIFTSGESDK